MARAIWSGVLSFGLVSVPVQIYSATEAHEPTFHQFEEGTSDRIRYQRVNERTGKEVDYARIVRGADIGGGNYVQLSQDELDSVAPGQSRSMEVTTFVDFDDIDPIYFNKTYFLGPGGKESFKSYALLRDAMAESRKVAIASFVMRGKEYLGAVRAEGDLLVLETLFFADEVRDPRKQVDDLPGRASASVQERRMAEQLVQAMSGPWQPSDYRDTYTDRVKKLITAKKNNKEVTPAERAPQATNVGSLVDALQASLDEAKQGKSTARRRPPSKRPPTKKATASGAAAKKKTPTSRTSAAKGRQRKGAA